MRSLRTFSKESGFCLAVSLNTRFSLLDPHQWLERLKNLLLVSFLSLAIARSAGNLRFFGGFSSVVYFAEPNSCPALSLALFWFLFVKKIKKLFQAQCLPASKPNITLQHC